MENINFSIHFEKWQILSIQIRTLHNMAPNDEVELVERNIYLINLSLMYDIFQCLECLYGQSVCEFFLDDPAYFEK